jgi:ABC-type multidrug transport system ATPase subunit
VSVEIRVDDLAPAIQAVGIVRRYAGVLALRGIDLTLQPGERLALIGPNAAGKTTLIRVLATALRPSSGALSIWGIDALRHATQARRLIGLVGQQPYLYGGLTARENLRFYARLYSVAAPDARIARVINEVGLDGRADEPVRNLSRGLQQRASLARAILHEPRLLLLDEPETGLDEAAQAALGTLLGEWADQGRSVVLATHRLDWAQHITDRTLALDRGAIFSETAGRTAGDDAERVASPASRSTT